MIHRRTPFWNDLSNQFLSDWPDETSAVGVLIGCSGGADSVALTRLVAQSAQQRSLGSNSLAPPVVVAHFNHRLRGDESEGDERFVAGLSEELGLSFISQCEDSTSLYPSDEAALRSQRRQFFIQAAKKTGCRYIAVAHTADDQAETVLHNALRGTGPAGLSGMNRATTIDEDLVVRRPLLGIRRKLIRDALSDLGQTWREDTSNRSSAYTRNWLRNEVLPMVRKRLPQADEALNRMALNQRQVNDLMTKLSDQWLDAFVVCESDSGERTCLRIETPKTSEANQAWCHGVSLARDRAVVTAACQRLYLKFGFGSGEMKREHWILLVNMILEQERRGESLRSRGHLPGHIEIRTNHTHVELSNMR